MHCLAACIEFVLQGTFPLQNSANSFDKYYRTEMTRKKKETKDQEKEEKIIKDLIDTRNQQVNALRKVLEHLNEETKKKVC